MKIKVERWERDHKKNNYVKKEEKIIKGKSANDVMRQFQDLRYVSDLFNHTRWEIAYIWDR